MDESYYDVITIGGATQDVFLVSDKFIVEKGKLLLAWGEKFLVDSLFIDIGGGAANSAVGFARLGFKTAFWGKVGMDIPGQTIAQRFKKEGVGSQFLAVDESISTSTSAVLVGKNGEHTIIMFRGHNDDLLTDISDFNSLTKTKWFYLTDLGGHTERLTMKIVDLVKRHKIKLAFIPGQHHLKLGLKSLEPVLRVSDALILNVYEASTLLRGEVPLEKRDSCRSNDNEVKEMLKEFYSFGAKIVVITRDLCGISAYDGNRYYYIKAPDVERVIDTTGAGDSFSSGFIGAVMRDLSVERALEWGSKNSGSVISKYGAQTGLLKHLD